MYILIMEECVTHQSIIFLAEFQKEEDWLDGNGLVVVVVVVMMVPHAGCEIISQCQMCIDTHLQTDFH